MYRISKIKFGEYIKRIRIERGISREELADKLYVSVAAICKWENGKRYPNFEILGNLANELGISTQDIFDNSKEESNVTNIIRVLSIVILAGTLSTGVIVGIISIKKHIEINRFAGLQDNQNDSEVGDGIDAYLVMGNVFQKEGITNGRELIYSYDWEENHIICSDPSCLHEEYNQKTNPMPKCSATKRDELGISINSFVFQGKRIVVENSIKSIVSRGNNDEVSYETIFYEADEDGTNRKKINTMDGLVYFASGIIYEDHLYCSVLKGIQHVNHEEYDEKNEMVNISVDSTYKYELCDLNLTDMTYVKLAESNDPYVSFNAGDHTVFCIVYNNETGRGTVYRINDGKAETFYDKDDFAALGGLINEKLMIVCKSDDEYEFRLYDINNKNYDVIYTGKEELCGVIGNNFLIETDFIRENDEDYEGYMSLYSEYDINGRLIRKLSFKDNINYCFLIDNKVIVFDSYSTDFNKKVGYYWIDINEFGDESEFENYIDLR